MAERGRMIGYSTEVQTGPHAPTPTLATSGEWALTTAAEDCRPLAEAMAAHVADPPQLGAGDTVGLRLTLRDPQGIGRLTEIIWDGRVISHKAGSKPVLEHEGSSHVAPLIPGGRRRHPPARNGRDWAEWMIAAVTEAVAAMQPAEAE